MVIITNKNLYNCISIGDKRIKPHASESFKSVDMKRVNYLVSTGDIQVKFVESDTNDTKVRGSRKNHRQDTIIIDSSNNKSNESSDDLNLETTDIQKN